MKESQILSFHNEKSIDMEVNSKRVPETFKVITPGKGKWVGRRITAFPSRAHKAIRLIKLHVCLNFYKMKTETKQNKNKLLQSKRPPPSCVPIHHGS